MSYIIKILIIVASFGGIMLLLGAVASIAIPDQFFNAIKQVFGYFGLFNFIIPVPTIIVLVILTLKFQASLLGYRGVRFIMTYFKPH
jgi:hypothetical protein